MAVASDNYQDNASGDVHHADECAHCPECGAPRVAGLDCWGQLGGILAWEWQDPELAAEHFLTVASYNLQHPAQFTHEAITGLRAMYIEYLDHGISIPEIRRRMGQAFEGNARVRRDVSERRPVLRQWPVTIDQVYLPDQPQDAVVRVRAWAAAIRRELLRQG